MRLCNFCDVISSRHLAVEVMRQWEILLKEEFPPLRSYLRPVDQLSRTYPGRYERERYRIVIHKDGTIIGIDDEDYDNRLVLSREDIVLFGFDLYRVRLEIAETFGFHPAKTAIDEYPRKVTVNFLLSPLSRFRLCGNQAKQSDCGGEAL